MLAPGRIFSRAAQNLASCGPRAATWIILIDREITQTAVADIAEYWFAWRQNPGASRNFDYLFDFTTIHKGLICCMVATYVYTMYTSPEFCICVLKGTNIKETFASFRIIIRAAKKRLLVYTSFTVRVYADRLCSITVLSGAQKGIKAQTSREFKPTISDCPHV
jgi:hypothetical protein